MTHQPPSPRRAMHPLLKRLLIILLAPVVAFCLFLAFVIGYSIIVGPIRWN